MAEAAAAGSTALRPVPRAKVAALLLNWRQPAMTAQCLGDLLALRFDGLAVLVVDNGSGDDSAPRLRDAIAAARATGRDVELLELPHNLGFAGAMNRGIEWASRHGCAQVLVLNNDVRLPPDFLPPLSAALDNDNRLAAVMPTVLLPDGRVWSQGGSFGFCANALRLDAQGRAPAPIDAGPIARAFLPCACVLFRTADLRAVQGFDESYFMYWEDADLGRRLTARGRRLVWLPWVRVTHAAGQSSGGASSRLRKYLMAKNCVRYLRRHGTLAQWSAFWLLDVLLLPLAIARSPRLGWAKLRGVVDGLLGRAATAADVARWRPRGSSA